MASLDEITNMFNFIENNYNPKLVSEECNNYSTIINTFLSYKNETFNNYNIYSKNKLNYPPIDFVVIEIIDHINNININININKLFCTLFWLYLKKFNQIEALSHQLTDIANG